jgi:hypothetical protein
MPDAPGPPGFTRRLPMRRPASADDDRATAIPIVRPFGFA